MDRVMHKVTLMARNQGQQSNTLTYSKQKKSQVTSYVQELAKIGISTNQKLPGPCSCSVKLMLLSASLLIAAEKIRKQFSLSSCR